MGVVLDAMRGAAAGAAATWVMDQVTQAMLDAQPPKVSEAERLAAVNGKGAVENVVDRVESETGFRVPLTAVHYGLGVVPGAAYAVLRKRVPLIGAGGGLVYGFLLWLVADEYVNSSLGLSAPPTAYPPETHLRGLVGHAVLGAATNSGIELLGG
jgi:uncharacterized membrane protein YagU involved in acid resistance